MREVSRKSLSIENYMKSLKEEFAKNFDYDAIAMGELEEQWADERLKTENDLVKKEHIEILH